MVPQEVHMADDRRSAERHPLRTRMDYRDATGGNFLYEYTQNISAGGIFIETREPLEVGTVVEMRFQPPGADEPIEVTGKVMWINPYRENSDDNPNPGMGIQFEDITEETKEQLADVVKAIAYL